MKDVGPAKRLFISSDGSLTAVAIVLGDGGKMLVGTSVVKTTDDEEGAVALTLQDEPPHALPVAMLRRAP